MTPTASSTKSDLSSAAALRSLFRILLKQSAANNFGSFVELTTNFLLERWQWAVCDYLQRIPERKGVRLLLHGPPQFGKSILVSQRWPCWILGKYPTRRIRLAAYNHTHAARFGKVNVEIMRSKEFQEVFPSPDAQVPRVCPAHEWSTYARSRLLDAQPSFTSLGLGSGFTGLGVDDMIIDDPYKNREEAYSDIINEGIWLWWSHVVRPRLNPETNVVVMFHRWKEDDLAGRLLEQGGWEYMRFPAIADGDTEWPDPLGRVEGELLSPRYPLEWLKEIEADDPLMFLALFQGRPTPEGGGMFREEYWQIIEDWPDLTGFDLVRSWDFASKVKEHNDWSVGTLLAKNPKTGDEFVLDVKRGRWEYPEAKDICINTAKTDPPGTVIAIEDTGNGTALAQDLRAGREGGRFAIWNVPVAVDKKTRAAPAASHARGKRVFVVKGKWYKEWNSELTVFPLGKHDDQVDSFSLGHNFLFGVRPRINTAAGVPGPEEEQMRLEREKREQELLAELPGDLADLVLRLTGGR